MRIFERELNDIAKDKFREYILEHVKFLFVVIPEEQAKIVFTMMNGNKAIMTDEDLIKAELLRCSSLEHKLFRESRNKLRQALLAYGIDGYPMSTGAANLTLCLKTEWRTLFEKKGERR